MDRNQLLMERDIIFKKLRVDLTKKSIVVNAPATYESILKGLEIDMKIEAKNEGKYDFAQVFALNREELEKLLVSIQPIIKFDAIFWACYPKKSGKIASDLQRESVWEAMDAIGLKAVTAVSIDDTWSALRGRPKEAVGK